MHSRKFHTLLPFLLCILMVLVGKHSATAQKSYDDYIKDGNSSDSLKDYTGAIASFGEAIKLKPDEPDPYYYRANASFDLKKYTDAISDYAKVIYLSPDYAEAWFNRGNALYELKKYSEAIRDFSKFI